MKRKTNKKVYDALTQKQSDYLVQAGWFENSKYSNGASIGGIAAVQNYGATINQNVSEKQRAFFHYIDIHLKPDTTALKIVIPPTNFWENCQKENKDKWREKIKEAWQSVFLGNISPETTMERLGLLVEGDIAKAIAAVDSPPLSPLTIEAKKRPYKDQKTTGKLTKRLSNTGQMLNALSHKVTKI